MILKAIRMAIARITKSKTRLLLKTVFPYCPHDTQNGKSQKSNINGVFPEILNALKSNRLRVALSQVNWNSPTSINRFKTSIRGNADSTLEKPTNMPNSLAISPRNINNAILRPDEKRTVCNTPRLLIFNSLRTT